MEAIKIRILRFGGVRWSEEFLGWWSFMRWR